jgi:hypothetical protein
MSLVTYTEAKEYLGLPDDSDQTLVESIIGYIEAEISAYCGRNFEVAVVTDEVLKYWNPINDPYYNPRLYERGITPVASVDVWPIATGETITITANGETLNSADYVVNGDSGTIEFLVYKDDSRNRLQIDYTGGYGAPGPVAPEDLKAVILEGVKDRYSTSGETSKSGSANVVSKKIGDFSVSYGDTTQVVNTSASGGTSIVKRYIASNTIILDKYRREV